MYLLNLLHPVECMMIPTFTFHYVSIKSDGFWRAQDHELDLHSTMYLLNLTHESHLCIYIIIYIQLCIY